MKYSLPKSEKLPLLRHSIAHIMAEAVMNLFPGTKVAIGPAVEHGFYYDFDLPTSITQDDLARIEKEMRRLLSTPQNFVKEIVSRQQALELFKDQPYKCELINDLPQDAEISIYRSGNFVDLCRGPHVANSKEINAQSFKLQKIAGAYWRGDEKRPMLTRIYGTAWETPNDLKTYLTMQAEAEKNDHRKIGRELDLFHIEEDNPGEVFWHPNGWTLYLTVQQHVRQKIKEDGYVEVNTPFVMPQSLWLRSGHWEKYKENMFITESEKRVFALKPMNCPGHVEIFKQGMNRPVRCMGLCGCVVLCRMTRIFSVRKNKFPPKCASSVTCLNRSIEISALTIKLYSSSFLRGRKNGSATMQHGIGQRMRLRKRVKPPVLNTRLLPEKEHFTGRSWSLRLSMRLVENGNAVPYRPTINCLLKTD